jgi:hypothetical protein
MEDLLYFLVISDYLQLLKSNGNKNFNDIMHIKYLNTNQIKYPIWRISKGTKPQHTSG